jgi:hypothetical protein
MMSGRVTVIPVDTSTEFPISGCPIPVEAIQDECERGMSLAERVVNSRARTAAGFAVGRTKQFPARRLAESLSRARTKSLDPGSRLVRPAHLFHGGWN